MTAAIGRRKRRKLKSEINVVPYIDVMLVLLIIFMVTAPLLSLGVDVELPQAQAKPIEQQKDPVVVTVTADGEGKSKVQWRGAFYRGFPNNDPPPELNDQAAIDAVTGVYKAGLDALKAEMEN